MSEGALLPLGVPDEFRKMVEAEAAKVPGPHLPCVCCGQRLIRGTVGSHACHRPLGGMREEKWRELWCHRKLDRETGQHEPPREGACGKCPLHCACASNKLRAMKGNLPRPYKKEPVADFLKRLGKALESDIRNSRFPGGESDDVTQARLADQDRGGGPGRDDSMD